MRIAILETDLQSDGLLDQYGTLADMFSAWLGPALPEARFEAVRVIEGEAPKDLAGLDGLLISGSRYGVYDDFDWIAPLEGLLRRARDREIPIGGICFGHQIMAQAFGGKVVKHEGGWVLGREAYGALPGSAEPRTALAFHQDQVIAAPEGLRAMSGNEKCRYGRFEYDFPALSVQYHPEFPHPYFVDVVEICRGKDLSAETADQAQADAIGACDSDLLAADFARFFRLYRRDQPTMPLA